MRDLKSKISSGLRDIKIGQEQTIEGWLQYGRALNDARCILESDEAFEAWLKERGLNAPNGRVVTSQERSAAMWAADNPHDFSRARLASGANTVREIHAHWKQFNSIEGLLRP